MIQPAAPAPISLLAAPPSSSGAGGESGAFALSLAGFLDMGDASDAVPSGVPQPGPQPGGERQGDADDGNILPGDVDADVPATDPALAWLAILTPVVPAPRPIAFVPQLPVAAPTGLVPIPAEANANVANPVPNSAASATDPTNIPNVALAPDGRPSIPLAQPASTDALAGITPCVPRPELVAYADLPPTLPSEPADNAVPVASAQADPKRVLAPVPPSVLALLTAAKAIVLPAAPMGNGRALPDARLPGATLARAIDDAPARLPAVSAISLPIVFTLRGAADPSSDAVVAPQTIVAFAERAPKTVTAPPLPTPLPDAAPLPAAIVQAFAGVLRSGATDDRPAATMRSDDGPAIFQITGGPAEARGVAVAAAGDTQQAPLNLSQQRWTHTIIDRIERMRDGIDAADTRIRLVPDALGSIDVSVRKDGDTLHVHFAAEQVATRTILQDAQPRLAEIAESRGLKLGQSAVGGGGAETSRQPPQPQQSQAPRPTPVSVERATDSTDTRIA